MPKYKTAITHEHGQKEALKRLKASSEWARRISDLQGEWNENKFTFAVSIQGVGLQGTIVVEEDLLKLDAQLPLIAMPFKSWFPNILRNALKLREAQTNAQSPTEKREQSSKTESQPTILFLHIPKAGGTTLGEFVYNQCRSEDETDEGLVKSGVFFLAYGFFKDSDSSVPENVQMTLQRRDLQAVTGHFSFGIHEYINRPWTYITLLRNPLERVVSLYHYMKLEDKMSLEEFASEPPFKEVDNDQTRRIAGVNPKVGALTTAHLEAAKENLRRHFAVVGITERMDETLVLLKRKLDWTKEIFSYPKNVNPHKPSTNQLSPENIKAILKRNELDFELYDYAAQLMDGAIATEAAEFYDELAQYQARRQPASQDFAAALQIK